LIKKLKVLTTLKANIKLKDIKIHFG